jgi:hypothetical protein
MIAAPAPLETKATPARCAVVHAWLTQKRRAELDELAQWRRTHPDQLVAQILDAILADQDPPGLVTALLERR